MAEVVGLDALLARVRGLKEKAQRPDAALSESADYMLGSIDKNFAAAGRPQRWAPHAESTLRGVYGPQKLLDRSGKMRGGFRPKFTARGWGIGNDAAAAYWPRQNFGYEGGGGGRGHSKTPARTFLLYQDEDIPAVGNIFADFFFH